MNTYIWKLNKEKLNNTNLYLYSNFIKQVFKMDAQNDFNKIWKWSIENPKNFWKSIWDFTKVKGRLGKILISIRMMILIKFGNGQSIIQKLFGNQFGILQK